MAMPPRRAKSDAVPPQRRRPTVRHKAKVFGIGEDGRKQYTKDPDARAAKRTATSTHPDGMYIGYELHAGIAVPAIKNTNTTTSITLGPEVPGVILLVAFVPAGTHRGEAVLGPIMEARDAGLAVVCNALGVIEPVHELEDSTALRPGHDHRFLVR